MIDIHTHIIPGFDDGSRSLDESIKIAKFEFCGGTQVMIATPHVQSELDVQGSETIVEKVDQLNAEFRENAIALRVVPGAEVFPSMSLLKGLDKGLPITLAGTGKYILLDLPHGQVAHDFDTVLFEIQSRGVTPILAHPERCPMFQPNPEKVLPYLERGIAFQLNMGSFAGRHGQYARSCANALFDMRAAQFLSSDAHRESRLSLGAIAKSLCERDSSYVKLLTELSGQAVLKGERLPVLPELVIPAKKKSSWFTRFIER